MNDWAGPSTFPPALALALPGRKWEEAWVLILPLALCYLGMLGESPYLSGCPFPQEVGGIVPILQMKKHFCP